LNFLPAKKIFDWHESFNTLSVKNFLSKMCFMKKMIVLSLPIMLIISCNNASTDSVEKADSANAANVDTAMNRNTLVIDEESSSFLVRVANSGIAEVEMTSLAQQKATYQSVKDFAGMLHKDHSAVNEQVRNLAGQKNIVLPATVSDEKQKEIDNLKNKTGKDFDRVFIKTMVDNHQAGIDMFQKAMENAKDADIKSFADKTLPALRMHLDSAKAIQKRYW
jgi:putative membrane protein